MVVTEASSFSPLLLPLAAAHSSCWLSLNAGWFAVVVMHIIIIIMLVGGVVVCLWETCTR